MYLGPPADKVAGNKDVHLVHKVVKITFWISRSVDGALLSICPLRQWLTKIRVKHCQKLTQIITSLCVHVCMMEATSIAITGCDKSIMRD